jgi:hypothetical protein
MAVVDVPPKKSGCPLSTPTSFVPTSLAVTAQKNNTPIQIQIHLTLPRAEKSNTPQKIEALPFSSLLTIANNSPTYKPPSTPETLEDINVIDIVEQTCHHVSSAQKISCLT